MLPCVPPERRTKGRPNALGLRAFFPYFRLLTRYIGICLRCRSGSKNLTNFRSPRRACCLFLRAFGASFRCPGALGVRVIWRHLAADCPPDGRWSRSAGRCAGRSNGGRTPGGRFRDTKGRPGRLPGVCCPGVARWAIRFR